MFALTMLLCDSAAIVDGKLNIHGGGWITCPASLTSHALGIIVESPSDYGGATITLGLTLTEEAGDPVLMFTDEGVGPLTVSQPLTLSPPCTTASPSIPPSRLPCPRSHCRPEVFTTGWQPSTRPPPHAGSKRSTCRTDPPAPTRQHHHRATVHITRHLPDRSAESTRTARLCRAGSPGPWSNRGRVGDAVGDLVLKTRAQSQAESYSAMTVQVS